MGGPAGDDRMAPFSRELQKMFDEQPIRIGGFKLFSSSAIPDPEAANVPNLAGFETALRFALATEKASPFWGGDLLAYAETRKEWRARLQVIIEATGLAQHTLENRASISRKVQGRARDVAPSITHAAVVQALDPDEQIELLEQAQTERWTVPELTRAKKRKERTVRAEGAALTMHTVDVTVRLTREAATGTHAEDAAWAAVRAAIAGIPHAKVIGARAFPAVGPLRVVKHGRTSAKAV